MLGGVGLYILAGCVDIEGAGFATGDDEEDTDEDGEDDEIDIDEELDHFFNILEDAGVEVLELHRENGTFQLEIQTGGNVDEDINRVASAYSVAAPELEADLEVRIEDRGLTLDTFEIEHEWALDHSQGRIDDQEYLQRVQETV